ncbi:uncharacterized protein LOC124148168 [Haliotis rufescens]|uniref:uncharacterized protein LOC124148168 n=1 Tax=Haliotis rufescens TaxID=6454 RepID=UPI001EAFDBF9|nr:uncharacterized protein LOC124148168 [Haliotis rufescens]
MTSHHCQTRALVRQITQTAVATVVDNYSCPTLPGLEMYEAFPFNHLRQRTTVSNLDSEVTSVVDASVRSLLDPIVGQFWRCVGCINRILGRTDPADELEEWVMVTVQNGQMKEVQKEAVAGETIPTQPEVTPIEFD